MDTAFQTLSIGGIPVRYAGYSDRIDLLDAAFKNRDHQPLIVGYANAHTIVLAGHNRSFRESLTGLDAIFADGEGVRYAAQILSKNRVNIMRQNATDFNYHFFQYAHRQHLRLFLLGATDEALHRIRARFNEEYSGIVVAGSCHGYYDLSDSTVVQKINAASPDALVIGMGHPKQEEWAARHRKDLRVPVVVLAGGFFDFFSGRNRRAPKIFRNLGLEWVYRFLLEPARLWRRYCVGIPQFCLLIVKEKFLQ